MHLPRPLSSVGLVLSGGGARGAYEVGVLAGLHEARARAVGGVHFDIVTGTSVGAINAVHVAASAGRADRGLQHLVELWTSLRIETHLRPRIGGLLMPHTHPRDLSLGRALLDARPFEGLVERDVRWDHLHENVRRGVVRAIVVSALNVANGRTVSFVETSPGGTYVPSRDASRAFRRERLTADHVLASAAIPLLFPARRVGDSYFCDGGLRFNTPISPAIRAGADRLLVIALRAGGVTTDEIDALEQYPNPVFLLGKLLDALLLDPIEHDLRVLERLNRMLEVIEQELDADALDRIRQLLESDRGLPYRRVSTLVFRPSEDLGALALEHLRRHRARLCRPGATATLLLENLAAFGAHVEADVLSYLLFDGGFARTLIELGRRDVKRRESEVEAFFSPDHASRTARTGRAKALV